MIHLSSFLKLNPRNENVLPKISLVLKTMLALYSCSVIASEKKISKKIPILFVGRKSGKIPGFADIHNHMFAEYAFGGAWLHGSTEGPESSAMNACSGNVDAKMKGLDHARTIIPFLDEFISRVPGTDGDTGGHPQRRQGYPGYEGWPRWDTIAHQQVYQGFLKKAHNDGLTLMVVSAVDFEPLCRIMPKKNRKYSCGDMASIHRQLDAANRFVKKNSDWVEVALDPYHAEKIIRSGKLAMIFSVETSDLLPIGNWKTGLEEIYAKGVRTLQPVHKLNNRFGGPGITHFVFNVIQILRSLERGDWPIGFSTDAEDHNRMGLTQEGIGLIEEMGRRRMLIDLAHLSERGVKEVQKVLKENFVDYPVYISHGHIREMMADKTARHEKATSRWILEYVRESGGVFGIRTGPEPTKSYGKVPNNCDGSTKSFAQVIQFADEVLKVPLGFGTDLNGFIQQLRPRFGNEEETCGAASTKAELKRQQRAQTHRLGTDFDKTGFGRIDQVGDILRDLKNFGVNTENLESSSETFIRMWRKAHEAKNIKHQKEDG